MAVTQPKLVYQPVMNILHIDDDEGIIESVRDNLSDDSKYSMKSALSPLEAVKLLSENNVFDIVIVDIYFEKKNTIAGDDFIRKSKSFFGDAKIIAFTGWKNKIKNINEKFFYKIFEKGEEEDDFYNEINEIFKDISPEIERRNNFKMFDEIFVDNPSLSNESLEQNIEYLINDINKADENEVLVIFEDKQLTAKQLTYEIENKTEIGKHQIKMLLDYLNHKREDISNNND